MKSGFFHVFRDDRGSVITEFTAGIAVLSILIFGIFDCARLFYVRHFVEAASLSAARYAMVHGSTFNGTSCASGAYNCAATATDVDSFVRSNLPPGVAPDRLQVSASWPGTAPTGDACSTFNGSNSPGCVVTVTVSYSFRFLFAFLPANRFSLSSASSLTITR